MQLEKFVTDWYTLYSSTFKIKEMKNCIFYISEGNLEALKKKINEILTDKKLDRSEKEFQFGIYKDFVSFIRRNSAQLGEDVMQTDELAFNYENNSYIVVVKKTKDVRLGLKELQNKNIDILENETIFIALNEEAQIITVKDSFEELIKENKVPVFCLNIRDKY